MNITLDMYSPVELRAFATFLNTVADAYLDKNKETLADRLLNTTVGHPDRYATEGVLQQKGDPVAEKTFFGEQTTAPINEQAMGASIGLVRKRGEPSPGHKRRTKAEIAEDDAAEKAEYAEQIADTRITKSSGDVFKDLNVDKPAAISTGGERVAPDDAPEVEQQDVADEADETAKAGAELSHENLRDSLGKYVQKFGMDAAQLDGPKLFALVFKNPAITKISAVPGDQASLKAALDGINEMLAKNPFDRAPVA